MKNPRVEITPFFVSDNTSTDGFNIWNSSTLFKAAQGLKPYDLQLAALDLDINFANANTIYNFLFQAKRVLEADLDYPIIQAPSGRIMDGHHRIIKAILEGRTTIKAVKLPVLPKADRFNIEEE